MSFLIDPFRHGHIIPAHMVKQILLAFTVLACLVGCTSVSQLAVKTKAPRDKVWQACIDSMPDLNYAVTSTDPSSGLLIGEMQIALSHGKSSRLNVSVSRDSDDTTVVVRFIPPPGAVGGGDTAERYVAALKKRIPNIEAVVAK